MGFDSPFFNKKCENIHIFIYIGTHNIFRVYIYTCVCIDLRRNTEARGVTHVQNLFLLLSCALSLHNKYIYQPASLTTFFGSRQNLFFTHISCSSKFLTTLLLLHALNSPKIKKKHHFPEIHSFSCAFQHNARKSSRPSLLSYVCSSCLSSFSFIGF